MSITIPNKIQKFKALEADFGTTNAVAIWRRAAQLLNYINASVPVGMLLFFDEVQDGATPPDSNYFKLCDGTAVSNANSPLNGVVLPDLRFKFIKHVESGGIQLVTGGSDTKNLNHNHTGFTLPVSDHGSTRDSDDDNERPGTNFHRHSISTSCDPNDLDPYWRDGTVVDPGDYPGNVPPAAPAANLGAVDIRPPYHSVKVYMRIV